MIDTARQWAALAPPTWSKALLYTGFAVWVITGIALVRANGDAAQRRVYWTGLLGGGALGAAAVSYRGAAVTVGAAALVLFLAVGYAYFFTSYLKVGDRILTLARRSGPDARAYGELSAAKTWWILVGLALIAAINAGLGRWTWQTTVAVALASAMAAGIAFDDGRRRATDVRGQYLQAVLVVVLSIPMWGAPVLVYLVFHLMGRLRPAPSAARHDAATWPTPTRPAEGGAGES